VDRRDFLKKGTGVAVLAISQKNAQAKGSLHEDASWEAPRAGAAPDPQHAFGSESSQVTPHELQLAEEWLAAIAPDAKGGLPSEKWLDQWLRTSLPFNFRYGGKEGNSLLPAWHFREGEAKEDSHSQQREFIWADPDSGLQVEWHLKRFTDFPAIEWTLWFENVGNTDTRVLEEIQDLHLPLNHSKKGEAYIVHGAHGGRYRRDDWWPFSEYLPSVIGRMRDYEGGSQIDLGGAYPSSRRNLPFISIETPENRGAIVGVGWTGNWSAHLSVENQELTARAGLKETHFVLHPGERARTARILVLLWEGKRLHGQNMLRSILHKHYIPSLKGKEREPMVSVNVCFTYNGQGGFLTQANEKNLSPLVNPFDRLGAEVFIVDAGWYPGGTPWNKFLGNWICSPERYPQGFAPLSQPLAKAKIDFGVWFAPEVVSETAPLFHQHPEWLAMQRTEMGGANLRLDLPEARAWFIEHVDDLIAYQGMTCYRQDGYNSDKDFQELDVEDRKGIGEIKYIMGFYALLDTIRERHPGLVMEAAAGAARIDLETLSRYHWHQPCETWLRPDLDQASTYGTSLWLPGGMIVFYNSMTGNYGAWSGFGGQLSLAVDPLDPKFPMDWTRQQVDLYKRVRPFLSGDFYPLTPAPLDGTWLGYQYHRSDLGGGFALVFKRADHPREINSVSDTFKLHLRGLDPQSQYHARFESSHADKTLTGEALAEGIELPLGKAPAAELITYQRAV
jgi:alpha-galactosidase